MHDRPMYRCAASALDAMVVQQAPDAEREPPQVVSVSLPAGEFPICRRSGHDAAPREQVRAGTWALPLVRSASQAPVPAPALAGTRFLPAVRAVGWSRCADAAPAPATRPAGRR